MVRAVFVAKLGYRRSLDGVRQRAWGNMSNY